jgi:rubrerythrin
LTILFDIINWNKKISREEKMAIYSVNEVIEMAVQIERSGYAFYNEAAKRKDLDEKAKDFLIYLRDEELRHEKTFLSLRDEVDLQVLQLSVDWELIAEYLKTIVESRIFNSEFSAIQLATKAKDIKEIVENAITFEKDTLLYFHTLSDNINEPRTHNALRKIINEEVSHILKLSEMKKKLV